jgi:hypothetical protein
MAMERIKIDLPPNLVSSLSDIEQQFIKLRSSGSSIRDIAKTLKKSTSTICNWNKKFSPDILLARNKSFCELQKKVIELKNSRIDFLKSEIERISRVLKKSDIRVSGGFSGYDSLFNRFVKISDILSAYENDILNVGVNFKDNISPESDLISENTGEENTVIPKKTNVTENSEEKITEKTEVKTEGKQNCNTETLPKKFFYKKQ